MMKQLFTIWEKMLPYPVDKSPFLFYFIFFLMKHLNRGSKSSTIYRKKNREEDHEYGTVPFINIKSANPKRKD